jgi:hypothetical protein
MAIFIGEALHVRLACDPQRLAGSPRARQQALPFSVGLQITAQRLMEQLASSSAARARPAPGAFASIIYLGCLIEVALLVYVGPLIIAFTPWGCLRRSSFDQPTWYVLESRSGLN